MPKVGGLDDRHGFLGLPVNDVLHACRPERIGCSGQQSVVSMVPLHVSVVSICCTTSAPMQQSSGQCGGRPALFRVHGGRLNSCGAAQELHQSEPDGGAGTSYPS